MTNHTRKNKRSLLSLSELPLIAAYPSTNIHNSGDNDDDETSNDDNPLLSQKSKEATKRFVNKNESHYHNSRNSTTANDEKTSSFTNNTFHVPRVNDVVEHDNPLISHHFEIEKEPFLTPSDVSSTSVAGPCSRYNNNNKLSFGLIINTFCIQPLRYIHRQWLQFRLWIGQSLMRCWFVLLVAILIELCATTFLKMAANADLSAASSPDDSSSIVSKSESDAATTATDPMQTITSTITQNTSTNENSSTKYTIFSLLAYMMSLTLFGMSIQQIDVGIAYAFWSAVGTASVAMIGMTWFNEPCTIGKSISIALIVLGVIGLNLTG